MSFRTFISIPKLDAKEIEKERGVILQELNMYEDTPIVQIGDIFEGLLYGDQPAGLGDYRNERKYKKPPAPGFCRASPEKLYGLQHCRLRRGKFQ